MIERFLTQHFTTALLIVCFSCKLAGTRDVRDPQIRYLWLSVICTGLLVIQDVLETATAYDASLVAWRTVFSVIGYVLRPVAALGILLVIAPNYPHRELLWMPAWINAAAVSTAFFSPIVFYFEGEIFHRGPLGFVPFAVGFLYILLMLLFLWKNYGLRFTRESLALYCCALGAIVCVLIDMDHGGTRINLAIMFSAIFCYLFLRSRDLDMDQTTGLLNRGAFYRDTESGGEKITAMAVLDMIGLKNINDTQGCRAADQALGDIGSCLLSAAGKDVPCYRMGDGLFLMAFHDATEREARLIMQQAQAGIQGAGHRVSVGLAVRVAGESPEELYRRAEKVMQADRVAFFQRPANNRRRITEPVE